MTHGNPHFSASQSGIFAVASFTIFTSLTCNEISVPSMCVTNAQFAIKELLPQTYLDIKIDIISMATYDGSQINMLKLAS